MFLTSKSSKATRAKGTEYAACATHTQGFHNHKHLPPDWPAPEAENGCSSETNFFNQGPLINCAVAAPSAQKPSQSTPGTGQKRQSAGEKSAARRGEQGRGASPRGRSFCVQVDDDVA